MKKFTIGGIASAIAVFAATTIALASPVNAAEAHAHVFKQYNQVAPTCTSQGYNAYRCECGVEQRSYISAMGHSYASKGYQTYSSSQHRMVRQCTRCGVQQYSYASHSYSISTTAASCTTSGKKVYRCATCGYSRTETIAATGHNFAGSRTYSTYSASQHRIATRCTRCSAQTVSYAAHVKNTLGTSCKYCGKAM